MAVKSMGSLVPHLPDNLDRQGYRLELDRVSDTLYWDFFAEPRPSISHPVTDHLLYSVDPETEEVIGLQIDGFLAQAASEFPELLALADLINLTPDEVARIRRDIAPRTRHQVTLRSILSRLPINDFR